MYRDVKIKFVVLLFIQLINLNKKLELIDLLLKVLCQVVLILIVNKVKERGWKGCPERPLTESLEGILDNKIKNSRVSLI